MTPRWTTVAFVTAARRAVADRGALVVQAAFYALVTAVLGQLWRAAAEAAGGTLSGYDGADLFWYIAVAEAAVIALPIRLIEQIGDDIGSGAVAVELLRPAPVLGVRLATELGAALPRVACYIAVAGVLGVAITGGPPPLVGVLLALPSMVLATVCNLLAQHAFAAAAFWVRDAKATWFLYQKLVFILGGMLIPLEMLPSWLQAAARVLPFAAMAYAPARLLAGHVEPGLLLSQLAWVAVLGLAAAGAFRAGERRLQIVGG
jgi:ABC-2 type transport system permease protein